jgi:hypothetical protein
MIRGLSPLYPTGNYASKIGFFFMTDEPQQTQTNVKEFTRTPRPVTMVAYDDRIEATQLYRPGDSHTTMDRIFILVDFGYPLERVSTDWIKIGKFNYCFKDGTISIDPSEVYPEKGYDALHNLLSTRSRQKGGLGYR